MKHTIRRTALFTAICLAFCGTGLLSACGKEDHVHDYKWETTAEATCTKTGSRTGVCQNSGCPEKEVTEIIPALGHDFGSWKEIAPYYATCTEGGKEERTCKRAGCGEKEQRDTLPLGHAWDAGVPVEGHAPTCTADGKMRYTCDVCGDSKVEDVQAYGHTWQLLERTKEPTCTAAGEESHRCTVCGAVEEGAAVAPLGHDWETTALTDATCTNPGTRTRTCTRCGETDTTEIAALGHNWGSDYVIDIPATFDHAGQKSYHCVRCGERDEARTVIIPQLNESTPIEYTFSMLRNNGAAVTDRSVTIHVYDEKGEEVARSRSSTLQNGVFKAQLLPRTYHVRVDGLPAGYSAEGEYEVNYSDPACKIWLTASPIETGGAGAQYGVGSVLHDFTYDTLNGETVVLSELLEEYKLVVLNFFYVGCTWCATEFPGLVDAYNKYKEDVCVIAIDPDPYGTDTVSAISAYAKSYGMTFYVVRDTSLRLHSKFGVSSYPQTAFIDREGVVAEYHKGAIGTSADASEKMFSEIFEKYIAPDYWKHGEGALSAATVRGPFAALPAKRKGE